MKIGERTQNISSRIQVGRQDGSLTRTEARDLRTDLQETRGAIFQDRRDRGNFNRVEKLQSRMSLDDLSGEVFKARHN